ncbi:IS256 family transposase [Gammaproteobacteria bacterium]|nr:IS256 family transposase [Gammaproteobacteria bacterium]
MAMKIEIIDELLKDCSTSDDIFGEEGLVKQFVKAISERALQAELSSHLGYSKHDIKGNNTGNSRNGITSKTVKGSYGETEIEVPRDRSGTFEPQFIKKGQTRFDGFDEKILSMYARGLTTRDTQAQLKELYGVDVSHTLISNVTDAVLDEVKIWQSRALDRVYPIIYFDAIMIKIRTDKQVVNKAIHLALGVNLDGEKELLGMWCNLTEGAKYWLGVLTELKNRGVEDVLICCCDGLTGFPAAIEAVYPKAKIQLCIVHLVRQSLRFVSWKDRKKVAGDLKLIYSSKTLEEAESALTEFADKWDEKFPTISKIWLRHWENITPFFDYPSEIRKVIYTTNAIESMNMTLRKVMKNKRIFPSDNAAFKQIYLALQNISKKWTMPIRDWKPALARFTIEFEGRI